MLIEELIFRSVHLNVTLYVRLVGQCVCACACVCVPWVMKYLMSVLDYVTHTFLSVFNMRVCLSMRV